METPKLIVRSCWCRNHKNVWKKRFLSAFEREKSCDQIKSVASNFSGFQGVGINIPSCSFQPFSLAVCKKRVQIEERPPWLEMSVCPHPNLGAWFGNQIWNPPFLLKRDVKRCSKNTDFFWLYRGFPSLIFFENIPFETGFQTRHTKDAQNVQKWAHKQPLGCLGMNETQSAGSQELTCWRWNGILVFSILANYQFRWGVVWFQEQANSRQK